MENTSILSNQQFNSGRLSMRNKIDSTNFVVLNTERITELWAVKNLIYFQF